MSARRTNARLALFFVYVAAGLSVFLFHGLKPRAAIRDVSTEACSSAMSPTGQPLVDQIVLIVFDALTPSLSSRTVALPSHDSDHPVLQYIDDALAMTSSRHGSGSSGDEDALLFLSVADPPTTTSARIKAMTTGTMPPFLEVSATFTSDAVQQDNLIQQLGGAASVLGDDTWLNAFPVQKGHWKEAYAYPSFDVRDLHTVDNGILAHLNDVLSCSTSPSASSDGKVRREACAPPKLVITHFLGLDHAGHRYHGRHPELYKKLHQFNGVLRNVSQFLRQRATRGEMNRTLVVVIGDHGMTTSGDHGGSSPSEIETVVFSQLFLSPEERMRREKSRSMEGEIREASERRMQHCALAGLCGPIERRFANVNNSGRVSAMQRVTATRQIDLTPTFAMLLGIPIPKSNVGAPIDELLMLGAGGDATVQRHHDHHCCNLCQMYGTYSSSTSGFHLAALLGVRNAALGARLATVCRDPGDASQRLQPGESCEVMSFQLVDVLRGEMTSVDYYASWAGVVLIAVGIIAAINIVEFYPLMRVSATNSMVPIVDAMLIVLVVPLTLAPVVPLLQHLGLEALVSPTWGYAAAAAVLTWELLYPLFKRKNNENPRSTSHSEEGEISQRYPVAYQIILRFVLKNLFCLIRLDFGGMTFPRLDVVAVIAFGVFRCWLFFGSSYVVYEAYGVLWLCVGAALGGRLWNNLGAGSSAARQPSLTFLCPLVGAAMMGFRPRTLGTHHMSGTDSPLGAMVMQLPPWFPQPTEQQPEAGAKAMIHPPCWWLPSALYWIQETPYVVHVGIVVVFLLGMLRLRRIRRGPSPVGFQLQSATSFVCWVAAVWFVVLCRSDGILSRGLGVVFLWGLSGPFDAGGSGTQSVPIGHWDPSSADQRDASPLHRGATNLFGVWVTFFAAGGQCLISAVNWNAGFVGVQDYSIMGSGLLIFMDTFWVFVLFPVFLCLRRRKDGGKLVLSLVVQSTIFLAASIASAIVHLRHLEWELFSTRFAFETLSWLAVVVGGSLGSMIAFLT